MTKNDLISAIAEKGGYSKKEAEQALAAVTETITEAQSPLDFCTYSHVGNSIYNLAIINF